MSQGRHRYRQPAAVTVITCALLVLCAANGALLALAVRGRDVWGITGSAALGALLLAVAVI